MMGHAMTARDLFSVGAAGAYGKYDLRRVADVVRRAYRLETSHSQPGAGEAGGGRRDQRGRPAKRAARKSGYYHDTNSSKPKAARKYKYMKAP